MNNLSRLLGPAPSELLIDEFIFHRLKAERARVERNLDAYRAGAVPSWAKKKKKPAAKKKGPKKAKATAANISLAQEITALLAAGGISLEDLKKLKEEN